MAKSHRGAVAIWWFVAAVIVLEFVAVLLFVPSRHVARYNNAERVSVAAGLGAQAEHYVLESANRWYRITLIDTGMTAALNDFLFGNYTPPVSNPNESVTNYAHDRVATFWRLLYALYYRVALIWLWIPYLLPLAIPALVDAAMERKVRQWRFSFVSPMTRAVAARAGGALVMALGVVLMIPLHVPPLAYPLLVAALLGTTWMRVANLQKRI